MPPLTENDLQAWHVTYRDDRPSASITAAYPAKDKALPGWVVFKDHNHKVVATVPEDSVVAIQRCTNDAGALGGLATRLIGDVRATACLPRHLEGETDGEAAKNEVALRTQVIKALMRDRVSDAGDGGAEFYAYLRDEEAGAQPEEILDIIYEDEDRFGPRLRVVLTGYTAPRRIEIPAPVLASSGG